MKQTFNIPEGCKVVTVEQIGNQLITSFEPEKYVPKKGDCVRMQYKNFACPTFCLIYKSIDGYIIAKNTWISAKEDGNHVEFEDSNFRYYDSIEKLTPEEFQAEFEKLGYVYDFETHTAHKKRWRAEINGKYYFVNTVLGVNKQFENGDISDDTHYEIGNYFRYRAEAEEVSEKIKKLLKQ